MSSEYTTQTLMERRFSTLGVDAFSDLDGDGIADQNVVQDSIDMASEEIDLWLANRYTPALLATSELMTRWATDLACYYLCTVRGLDPPGSLATFYENLTKERTGYLWRLMKGIMQLPGVPLRADLRPTMSNMVIDRRWRWSKARVTRTNSTDAPSTLSRDDTIDIPTLYD